jgi:DNA-binding NarL/FixJ family response regulator
MPDKKIHLLIADDHPIFRKGLKDILLESFKDISIIECVNGLEAFENTKKHLPQVVILDINMPEMNGLEACKAIVKDKIDTKIIILTMYREKEMIRKAMLAGASGYLLKDNAVDEILDCINQVQNNEKYIGTALLPYYNQINEDDRKKTEVLESIKLLSQAELKTLKLVSQNKTSKEIAELLFLSEKTVENYRSRICAKIGLPPRNNSLVLWVNENKDLLSTISEF